MVRGGLSYSHPTDVQVPRCNNVFMYIISSSSSPSAGQRFTPHNHTLEVRPGRISKKLELDYDYNVKGIM